MFAQKEDLCKRQLTTDNIIQSESPTVQAMRGLENRISEIKVQVQDLQNRLMSVMKPDINCKVPETPKVPQIRELSSPLRDTLDNDTANLDNIIRMLNDISSRLEI